MHLAGSFKEDRHQRRTRRSDPLVWRTSGSLSAPQPAALLESSEDGLAFTWRGADPPKPGTLIDLQIDSAAGAMPRWQRCVVRHLAVVHDDLCVFGIEILRFNDFPPAPALRIIPDPSPLNAAGHCEPKPAVHKVAKGVQWAADFVQAKLRGRGKRAGPETMRVSAA